MSNKKNKIKIDWWADDADDLEMEIKRLKQENHELRTRIQTQLELETLRTISRKMYNEELLQRMNNFILLILKQTFDDDTETIKETINSLIEDDFNTLLEFFLNFNTLSQLDFSSNFAIYLCILLWFVDNKVKITNEHPASKYHGIFKRFYDLLIPQIEIYYKSKIKNNSSQSTEIYKVFLSNYFTTTDIKLFETQFDKIFTMFLEDNDKKFETMIEEDSRTSTSSRRSSLGSGINLLSNIANKVPSDFTSSNIEMVNLLQQLYHEKQDDESDYSSSLTEISVDKPVLNLLSLDQNVYYLCTNSITDKTQIAKIASNIEDSLFAFESNLVNASDEKPFLLFCYLKWFSNGNFKNYNNTIFNGQQWYENRGILSEYINDLSLNLFIINLGSKLETYYKVKTPTILFSLIINIFREFNHLSTSPANTQILFNLTIELFLEINAGQSVVVDGRKKIKNSNKYPKHLQNTSRISPKQVQKKTLKIYKRISPKYRHK